MALGKERDGTPRNVSETYDRILLAIVLVSKAESIQETNIWASTAFELAGFSICTCCALIKDTPFSKVGQDLIAYEPKML